MKGLVLSSLLSLIKSEISTSELAGSNAEGFDSLPISAMNSVTVYREDSTDERKRIDIVVVSDHFVIGIEVKVNHVANNDFSEYSKHLDSLVHDRELFKVPLGKEKISIGDKAHDFISISYSELWNSVLNGIGSVALSCDPKWFFHLTDFILQTKNFNSDTIFMNTERLQFFEKYSKRFGILEKDMNLFKSHIVRRIHNIAKELGADREGIKVERENKDIWFTNDYSF